MSGTSRPPPFDNVSGPTIEQLADIEKARREAQEAIETLVACEGPCRTCPCCHGENMISVERWAEWRRITPQGG